MSFVRSHLETASTLFFPMDFQINYLQVKDTPVLIALSYLLIYPIFHLIVKVFFIAFGCSQSAPTLEITILTKLDNAYWLG